MRSDETQSELKPASITAYFESAWQGQTQWWAWVSGTALIIALSFVGMLLLGVITAPILPQSSTGFYILALLSFLPIFIVIPLVYKMLHELPLKALFTSAGRYRWGYMWRTILIIFLFYGFASLVEYVFFPQEFEGLKIQNDMKVYTKLLLVTLLLVPFQAAAEEFLCRGYLNQALIKYLRSPWAVFILTSAGFAALHAWNSEAQGQMGPYLASIFLYGMTMCVLLYFEGGIESAIGAHIANNIFVFGFLGYETTDFPNTALLTLKEPVIAWHDVAIDLVLMTILVMLILWTNRKWGRES